jgi:hypothetical protein
MQIVGLCGFIGSGKTTAAQHLVDRHQFVRMSFADPLKDVVGTLFGWSPEQMSGRTPESRAWREQPDPYWSDKLGRPWSPRHGLQYIGTDVFRAWHDRIWVDAMEHRIRTQTQGRIVIDDVRFPNEMDALHRMGAKICVIRRMNLDGTLDPTAAHQRLWENAVLGVGDTHSEPMTTTLHPSEWEWLTWSRISACPVLINDQPTVESFEQVVEGWYTKTFSGPTVASDQTREGL